jgi:hypothetical protein
MGRDPFRIDHRFIRRHVEVQVLLVNAPEATEIGTERRTGAFAGVAMHLVSPIAILIPRPLMSAMAHGHMGGMTTVITLPFIGIEDRVVHWYVLRNEAITGRPVRVVTDPPPRLPGLPRDNAENRGTVIRIGAMALPLIGPAAWGISGVGMPSAFFPPRSDRVRLPQSVRRSSNP